MATTRRARVGRAAGKLSLLIGSTLLTLLAAELVFRALDIRGHHERRRELGLEYAYILDEEKRVPMVGVQYRPYAKFGHAYDSNPEGYFDEGNRIIYSLNKHGFRGGDYETEKAPGTRRIVLLGDSFTFGEGVRFEDTFGYRLQEILDRDEAAVEVLSFAVGGWGTRNEISYLERAGLRFEPDLVIVVYVLNDAGFYALNSGSGAHTNNVIIGGHTYRFLRYEVGSHLAITPGGCVVNFQINPEHFLEFLFCPWPWFVTERRLKPDRNFTLLLSCFDNLI